EVTSRRRHRRMLPTPTARLTPGRGEVGWVGGLGLASPRPAGQDCRSIAAAVTREREAEAVALEADPVRPWRAGGLLRAVRVRGRREREGRGRDSGWIDAERIARA